MATINLVTEVLVIIALLGLILFIEPKGGFFLILILGILVLLFVRLTNQVVGKWGRLAIGGRRRENQTLATWFWWLKRNSSFWKNGIFFKAISSSKPHGWFNDKKKRVHLSICSPNWVLKQLQFSGLSECAYF